MKITVLAIIASATFLWGIILGSGMLKPGTGAAPAEESHIEKPTITLSLITVQTAATAPATESPPITAQVQIIPDTPIPDYQYIPIDPPIFQEPIGWIAPLDPAAPVPNLPSPYDAISGGPVANLFAAPLPPEVSEMSLDQLWDSVEAFGLDDRLRLCIYPLPAPFVTWEMAMELSELQTPDRVHPWIKMRASDIAAIALRGGGYFPGEGIVQVLEDGPGSVKSILIEMYYSGAVNGCRNPATNKPDAYNVQPFLDTLAANYLQPE